MFAAVRGVAQGGAIYSAGSVSMDSAGELRLSADIASSDIGYARGGAIYAKKEMGVKEKLAFWRKKTPEPAAEGGGVHEQ